MIPQLAETKSNKDFLAFFYGALSRGIGNKKSREGAKPAKICPVSYLPSRELL